MAFDKDAFLTALDSMTVMELNDLVKAIEEKFGVSAAAMSAPAAAGGGAGVRDRAVVGAERLARQALRYDIVHDNQCLGTGLLGFIRDDWPFVNTLHHPITVDRDLDLAAANSPLHSVSLHVSRCTSSKALPYRLLIVD